MKNENAKKDHPLNRLFSRLRNTLTSRGEPVKTLSPENEKHRMRQRLAKLSGASDYGRVHDVNEHGQRRDHRGTVWNHMHLSEKRQRVGNQLRKKDRDHRHQTVALLNQRNSNAYFAPKV